MSEERLASDGDSFVDLTQMETVDLLNKLSDENTKLHKKVDEQQLIINEQNEAIEYLKTVIRYTLPNQMVADVFKEIGEEYE